MSRLGGMLLVVVVVFWSSGVQAQTFYISPIGQDSSDQAGDAEEPWRSVNFAVQQASEVFPAGGFTILVLDGSYSPVFLDQVFSDTVTILAVNPFVPVVSGSNDPMLQMIGAVNITVDGIVFDRNQASSGHNVGQIQGGSNFITIRNCVFTQGGPGGFNNSDALKINDSAHHVLVEHSILYDPTDEIIDILGDVHDIVVRDNVLYHSGDIGDSTQAGVKDDAYRIVFDGNLFANQSATGDGNAPLRIGEAHTPPSTYYNANEIIIINNVIVAAKGEAAISFIGSNNSLVANNVIYDYQPVLGSDRSTFRFRRSADGGAFEDRNDNLVFLNNIVMQPADNPLVGMEVYRVNGGSILTFITGTPRNNLYYNGGQAVPSGGAHNPNTETERVIADPLFVDTGLLVGTPDFAWLDFFKLMDDSPAVDAGLDVADIDLSNPSAVPDSTSLAEFLDDYLNGDMEDVWYDQIKRAGYRDAFGTLRPQGDGHDIGIHELPATIPCADVRNLRARCTETGGLLASVVFTNASHNGKSVTLDIDSELHTRTINARNARLFLPRQGGTGERAIELVDPAGCVDPVVVSCP